MRKLFLNLIGFLLVVLAIALVAAKANGTNLFNLQSFTCDQNEPGDDAERMTLYPCTAIRLDEDPNNPDDDAERILCSSIALLLDNDPNDDDAERMSLYPASVIKLDDPNKPDDDAERI